MQLDDVREIIACLPKGKTPFWYFKDRYALLLLGLAVRDGMSKREIRSTRFAKLLDKEVVKTALRQNRGGPLSTQVFNSVWPARYECYFLTLDVWGSKQGDSWDQTSRRGFNLVLQLNFSSKHDEPYRKLIDPEDNRPFEYGGHPIAEGKWHTLAWARMDIDFAANEALIEEIQSDWIREALWAHRMACSEDRARRYWGPTFDKGRIVRYVDCVLKQHEATWHEAMLSATIWFLREELGIGTIFYHTFESGAELKSMGYSRPPRSLYSRLPRQFCFAETGAKPAFLWANTRSRAKRERLERARFFEMKL